MRPPVLVAIVWFQVLKGITVVDAFATLRHSWPQRISFQHDTSRAYQRVWPLPSSPTAASDEDEEDDTEELDANRKSTFSKAKWKKKRYLMMKDVHALIEKGDGRAPHKAREIILRMLKLSEIHEDEGLRPNAEVYNVKFILLVVPLFLLLIVSLQKYLSQRTAHCASLLATAVDQCDFQMLLQPIRRCGKASRGSIDRDASLWSRTHHH